jgi:hypothetical protein
VPDTPPEDHYASAAERHLCDAEYLHDDGRLPNADYHFGFAVECALKSLLLRFLGATMAPKPNGKPAQKPWTQDSATNKLQEYGHLPWLATDITLLAHGRTGAGFITALDRLSVFTTWTVDERYRDGSAIDGTVVTARQGAAHDIVDLHQQALLQGRLR